MVIWNQLEDLRRRENLRRGYLEVKTPLIYDKSVWQTSGHWEKFRGEMFLVAGEGEEPHAGLKPMNCPGHMLLFGSQLRSYRDLPLRYAESSTLHRNEPTGTLHGLLRVRHVTQDDAHIFCTREQIEAEIFGCLDYAAFLYDLFGMEARFELSTRPENRLGADEEWDFTEAALRTALERRGIDFVLNEGDGAFYGPKIDLHMLDVLGRSWQMGTIQLDALMPKQFGLTYMGADNVEHTPYVVHRALLGSLERFMGILIEHYGGAFPTWLAPVQVRVLPVAETHRDEAHALVDALEAADPCARTSTSETRPSASGSATPSSRRSHTSSSGATARRGMRWPCASGAAKGSRRCRSTRSTSGRRSGCGADTLLDATPGLQSRSGIAPHPAGHAPREVQPSRIRRGNAAAACSGVSAKEEDRLDLVKAL